MYISKYIYICISIQPLNSDLKDNFNLFITWGIIAASWPPDVSFPWCAPVSKHHLFTESSPYYSPLYCFQAEGQSSTGNRCAEMCRLFFCKPCRLPGTCCDFCWNTKLMWIVEPQLRQQHSLYSLNKIHGGLTFPKTSRLSLKTDRNPKRKPVLQLFSMAMLNFKGVLIHLRGLHTKLQQTGYHQKFQVPKMEVLTYVSCM